MRKVTHPDFPEYLIRDDGFVERAVDSRKYQKAGDLLTGRVLKSGYRQFNLNHRTGRQRLVRANRLVCEAFHGPAPSPRHHAAHRDGDRLNNKPNNLYWATPTQNKQDSRRHGTLAFGSKVGNQFGPAKMNADAVRYIRANYTGAYGEVADFAEQFNVSNSCIQNIVTGTTWRHVS